MGSQKQSGKAFEYAMLQALCLCVGDGNHNVIESAATKVAAKDFDSLSGAQQQENVQAGWLPHRYC